MPARKHPNETIFVVGSTFARHAMKRRLIEESLIPYRCADCDNPGHWNGKQLSLQIDHINGVATDNRLENLRFMCPNCHAQTDTYAGKNSKGMRPTKPKPNLRAEKLKRDRQLWEEMLTDKSLQIGVWGWKGRAAKRIGITSQKLDKWLLRVDPTFHGSMA